MKILKKEIDIAGKTRVLVEMENGEVQMFKFNKSEKDIAILIEAERSVANKVIAEQQSKVGELEDVKAQIVELTARKVTLESELTVE